MVPADHAHETAHAHDRPHAHDDGPSHGHGHGHSHDHDHAHGGWWHQVKHALVPHSHDAADSIDSAMETSARGIRAVKISLVGLGITAVAQLAVVAVSGSVALLADTIHNFSDALTAVPLWIAFVLGRRRPSRRYTYGLGRAEDLAGLFVLAMIAASAVVACWESVDRLLHPQPVQNLGWVALAGFLGFLGNEAVAVFRIREGRAIGSAALVADGQHARTDGLTSLAVLLGAGGAALGWQWADPVVGLLITVAILLVLRVTARDVLRRLLDGIDPGTLDQARHVLDHVPGVRGVADLRMRWVGHALHADAVLVLDPGLTLAQAHTVTHDAEDALVAGVRRLTTAVVHPVPDDAGALAGCISS